MQEMKRIQHLIKKWNILTLSSVFELQNLRKYESCHQNENGNGRGKEKGVNGVEAKKRVTRLKVGWQSPL